MLELKQKFKLGKVCSTPGALEVLGKFEINTLLMRHSFGDWSEACESTKLQNDEAVKNGEERILSVYKSIKGVTIWIITEYDRSATKILLPEEY